MQTQPKSGSKLYSPGSPEHPNYSTGSARFIKRQRCAKGFVALLAINQRLFTGFNCFREVSSLPFEWLKGDCHRIRGA